MAIPMPFKRRRTPSGSDVSVVTKYSPGDIFISPHWLLTLGLIAAVCFGLTKTGHADSRDEGRERPKVALVLAGGGAKGVAHVGVIKVLEEAGVRVDLIVGTSMGAIVGGLYATGLSAVELQEIVQTVDWESIFIDNTPRQELTIRRKTDDLGLLAGPVIRFKDGKARLPLGAIKGQRLTLELQRLSQSAAHISDFDDLPIPFRAVATDIETGEEVVIGGGDLALAMRASMSIPGAFPPVRLDGRTLVDGGFVNNVPISVARSLGADTVIVAAFREKLLPVEKLTSAVSILSQSVGLMILKSSREQLASLDAGDVLIMIDPGDIGTASFDSIHETIPLGEAAARAQYDQLAAVAVSGREAPEPLVAVVWGRPIRAINIDNDSPLSDGVIRARMRLREGTALDLESLDNDIARIYGLGHFQTVTYAIDNRPEGVDLTIIARQNTAGLDQLRLGLRLENDFDGESNYDVGVGYTRSAINELNGEVRITGRFGTTLNLFAEFYQPMDEANRFFIAPAGRITDRDVDVFRDGRRIAETRVARGIASLRAGINVTDDLATFVIVTRGVGQVREVTGVGDIPEDSFDTATIGAGLYYDNLDTLQYPRDGGQVFAEYIWSTETLGADNEFQSLRFSANLAGTWGDHTLVLGQVANLTLHGEPGTSDLFVLGGPFRLSGFVSGEVTGKNAIVSRLIYYNEIAKFGPSFIDLPLFLGASLEYGNVFEDKNDIEPRNMLIGGSVFLGADTFLGPAYLGYGLIEGGDRALYFFVGSLF